MENQPVYNTLSNLSIKFCNISDIRMTDTVEPHYKEVGYNNNPLKVLGKSVGLCKTTKRKDQLYISLLVSVWRIICENFNPNGLILAEI